jgi:WD40 repeat protein
LRALHLSGLDQDKGQQIIAEKGFDLPTIEGRSLVERYGGNPLALKIVATTIHEVFAGNVAEFLAQGPVIFGDISDLLAQQFDRLMPLEKQVMIWLAINREGVSLAELQSDIVPPVAPRALLEAVESLQHRSLIEQVTSSQPPSIRFTQQPVVMEYVTDRLINQISAELIRGEIGLCDRYALSKAQTKDYLRNTQHRLILQPVVDRLLAALGHPSTVQQTLDTVLAHLKTQPAQRPGYTAGNLINLLSQLKVNLKGYDFSHLAIRQVYLPGVNLQAVNFAHADLTRSVFTQTLGDLLTATFSPDGTVLATAIDREILLWQIADRKQIATLIGHTAWILSVAFSPDGQFIASGSNDQTLRLWDAQTGQCLKTLKGHTSGVQSVAFSLDSSILASGSHDHTIQLWDVQTQQWLRTLSGHGDRVLGIIFCPDHQTLISSSEDHTIRMWDIHSGKCLRTLNTQVNWVLAIALSPDGQTLVTGSDSQTVKFWDVPTGACTGSLPDYHTHVWAVTFSPDGQLLATASADKTVRLWDVQTHQCLKIFQEHTNQVWLVNFSPDGQTLVSSGDDQAVRLWEIKSGQCLTSVTSYSNWISSVAFNPNGNTLASGSKDQFIRLWDLTTGQCRQILTGHTDIVMSVTFSPDGSSLASASDDRTIKLWDAHTGECANPSSSAPMGIPSSAAVATIP